MNKEEFNELGIEQQVKYINKGLESESVTKVCASIGIDRATVRKRFKNNGYELIDNKYILTDKTTDTTVNTKEVQKELTTTNTKTTEKKQGTSNTKALEKKIKSLELEIQGIKDILTTITTTNTNISTAEVEVYEGAEVVRSYRINEEVQKQWKVFCRAHSEYKVGDLLANAMVDYMNKLK